MTRGDSLYYIKNAKIIAEHKIINGGALLIRNRVIERIYEAEEPHSLPSDPQRIDYDAGGSWIVPGFIDVHVHGGNGLDFMTADPSSMLSICRFHAENGTTGLLVTTVAAAKDDIERTLDLTQRMLQSPDIASAQLLGVHLEGPFLNPLKAGAQNPAHITLPRIDWIEDWALRYPKEIRMVTLAPELPGALELIRWMSSHGIISACGHTNATYEEIILAVDNGLRHAVHFYNAMTGLNHRQPGVVGAIFASPLMSAEVIADGQHVHPACIKLLADVKALDKVLLITDAISAAGSPDGDYSIGGTDITVKDGVASLKGAATLAGSTLTMIKAFRYMAETVGIAIEQVSRMASGNPAILLDLYDTIGSIREGKDADIVAVGHDWKVKDVWIKGYLLHK